MCAVGLSLIFGTTGLINFAHSELVTFGAIVAWYLHADTIALPLVVAGVLAIGIAGIAGGGLEIGVLRPLRQRAQRRGAFWHHSASVPSLIMARYRS